MSHDMPSSIAWPERMKHHHTSGRRFSWGSGRAIQLNETIGHPTLSQLPSAAAKGGHGELLDQVHKHTLPYGLKDQSSVSIAGAAFSALCCSGTEQGGWLRFMSTACLCKH